MFWTNSIIIDKENINNVQGPSEILGRGAVRSQTGPVEVIFQLSSVGDDQIGVKIKPKNIPRASNKTPKNPILNFQALQFSRKH